MTPATTNKILIVEDNALAREALALILKRHGFEANSVPDGREALLYLAAHAPPDLILLDMRLPTLDGWQFLDEFRSLDLRPRPRVVIATSSPAISREWAADRGCHGFLQKPIRESELIDELRHCLKGETGPPRPGGPTP